MKIAVLITGEYRTFDSNRKSMRFLDQPNIDVYFSTWGKTVTSDSIKYEFDKEKKYRVITEEIIHQALQIPATIAIHNDVPKEVAKIKGFNLLKSWYLGFELIRKSGIQYDYVLVTRPDLYFTHGEFDFSKFPEVDYSNFFAVSTLPNLDIFPLGLDDHCFFTTYDNMDKILSLSSVKELAVDNEWHSIWYEHITERFNLKITQCPVMGDQSISAILKFDAITASNDIPITAFLHSTSQTVKRAHFLWKTPPKDNLFIFDLDGVLIDIKNIHYNALNKALASIDEKYIITMEEHIYQYDGLPTRSKLELLTTEKGLSASLHQKVWELKQHYTFQLLNSLKLYDRGIVNLVDWLKKHNNLVAVASNSTSKTLELVLANLGIITHIDFYISSDDVENPKPHPEMYWECMKFLKTSPKKTYIIEDSPIGLVAAEASGATSIYVQNRDKLPNMLLDSLIKLNNKPKNLKWKQHNLTVLIPMAGEGTRFKNAGYSLPKPLIDVNGKPMIQSVVENLNIEANYVFLVQETHCKQYNLPAFLKAISPNCEIITVPGNTEGAACTTLLARHLIDNKDPLLIVNSDQLIEWDSVSTMYDFNHDHIQGGILTFTATDPKWSFVKTNSNGHAIQVAEKKPISEDATCGLYYWARGEDYVKYANQMIRKNIRVNNEFYICPVYNEALADGFIIKTSQVKNMHGLGTPEDLSTFLSSKIEL